MMTQPSALPTPTPTYSEGLRARLQLVPPGRIIAAEEDSPDVLTLGDLRQFAKYLANEFLHQADTAAGYPASWYAEQIEYCTPAQADTVRSLTIELCQDVAMYRGYHQGMLAGGERRAEALDAFGCLMAILLLLAVVPLLMRDDPDRRQDPAPRQPAAAVQAVAR